MNYNDYIGERMIQDRKVTSQAVAEQYIWQQAGHPMPRPAVTVRLAAFVGATLVTVGYRLQARYETMTDTTAVPSDAMLLSHTGSPTPHC